ncbi:PH domain-containing protein [uncultured Pseudodesulfovibrio sp.]|uniref:PH domain-containing protein n=1 Tax=uncultured Pseudodesulfovibrio sp. TaxID=2035858 RepID=UPI0029C6F5CF|nr:PH domain-containing protein [uncultured Pseudodesulfovibrio sp.]
MANTYKIPMKKIVLIALLAFIAVVAAAVTWSFRSGLLWTGICLIAVAGPLSILYWYMLYINPKRASITVADEGVLLAAPPFASAVIPWAAVEKAFPVNLVTDEDFKAVKTKKMMQFAGYRSGIIELKGSKEAVVVANRPDVLCLQTEERFYLLGPSDIEGFTTDVDAVMSQK